MMYSPNSLNTISFFSVGGSHSPFLGQCTHRSASEGRNSNLLLPLASTAGPSSHPPFRLLSRRGRRRRRASSSSTSSSSDTFTANDGDNRTWRTGKKEEGGRNGGRKGGRNKRNQTFTEILHTQVTEEEQEGLLSALYSLVSSRRSSLPPSSSSSSPSIDAVAVMGSLPAGVPPTYYAKARKDGKEGGRVQQT